MHKSAVCENKSEQGKFKNKASDSDNKNETIYPRKGLV